MPLDNLDRELILVALLHPSRNKILGRQDGKSAYRLIIHEGKNRQVRRMFKTIGHPIIFLRKERIGNLTLGELRPGSWRHLSVEEVRSLKILAGE